MEYALSRQLQDSFDAAAVALRMSPKEIRQAGLALYHLENSHEHVKMEEFRQLSENVLGFPRVYADVTGDALSDITYKIREGLQTELFVRNAIATFNEYVARS